MSESGKHLNLVFAEDGDDPLVLESSWTGAANREAPDLTHVGQAKPRLRAMCILLLLAKYQGIHNLNAEGVLPFQVRLEKDTWIYTLGNVFKDAASARKWIEGRFHIRGDEHFIFASPGSTQNLGGMEYPRAEYRPNKKLPLTNLHLFVKPRHCHPQAEARPLLYEGLFAFALKLESKHWKESAIKKLFSYELPVEPGENDVSGRNPDNDKPLANTPKEVLVGLMEKEFNINRANCQPLYWRVGRESAKLPYKIWNEVQLQVLAFNSQYLVYFSTLATTKFQKSAGHLFEMAIRKSECQGRTEDDDIMLAAVEILSGVSKCGFHAYCSGQITAPEDVNNSHLLLKEAQEVERILRWSYENESHAVAFGTYVTQRRIISDYLTEICLHWHRRDENEVWWYRKHFERNVRSMSREYERSRDVLLGCCDKRSDFLQALQGMRLLLKAQGDFCKALHGRLLALKTPDLRGWE